MVATQSIQNFLFSITLAMTRLPVLAGRHHEPTMQKRSEEKNNDRIAMQVNTTIEIEIVTLPFLNNVHSKIASEVLK